MDGALRGVLDDLYRSGQEHDVRAAERTERMLNITPETGEFLRALVIAGALSRVLELGTSNGYSTIWLADACRHVGGRVTSIDRASWKLDLTRTNLERAGLRAQVDLVEGEIADFIDTGAEREEFDLVFLDCDRDHYMDWWSKLQRMVRPGGLLVVDNVTSHAEELQPFIDTVRATHGFASVLIPLGNGELLVLREPDQTLSAAN